MNKIIKPALTLMGYREYAKYRGCKQSSVSQAISSGRIAEAVVLKGGRKKIDVEKADSLWAMNTTQTHRNSDISAAPASAGAGLIKAKAVKETFAAKLAQIKYEQQSGKLCRIEDVKRAAAETARITRDSLLSMPDRLAPILASETDIHIIKEKLIEEITLSLNNLSQINWDKILEQGKEK